VERQRTIAFSEEGLKIIQERIDGLRVDLGASVAMLLDESGQLLTDCGWHGDFDLNTFLALVGNEMSAANAVVHLLRDDAAFDLHYHEGQNYEMYTVRISDQVFFTMILERRSGTSSRVGMVWLTLRRAIAELRTLLNRATIKSGTRAGRAIRSTVSDALGEALNLLESDAFLSKPTAGVSPAVPAKPAHPPESATAPAPPPPAVSPDSRRVLTYEEARALGLIDMDDSSDNARESER
jgi:hypothetical protein